MFVLKWLRDHRRAGYSFTVVPVASHIQKIEVIRTLKDGKKLRFEFLDSMKLLPYGLDKVLKTFGLGGKVDMDLHAPEDDDRWAKYLTADCVKLHQALTKVHELVEERLGGEVGMTAPSTAMKLFRRKYLNEPIYRHLHFPDCQDKRRCNGCLHAWILRAYYGGRTEIFEMMGEFLKYFDINSSYVAAMLQSMPVGRCWVQNGGVIDFSRLSEWVGFAEVTVRIPEDCELPPLPYRADSGKLIFPTGTFSGVWDLKELELLSRPEVRGEIVSGSVGRVVWIKAERVFEDMMRVLYALRDKENPDYNEGLAELAKLLGNSFYGKFGMDPEKEEIVFEKNVNRKEGQDPKLRQCLLCQKENLVPGMLCEAHEGSKKAGHDDDCDVWFAAKRVEAAYIIPQIAAHITTIARVCLWHHLVTAKKKRLVVVKDGEREIARRSMDDAGEAEREVLRWTARGFDDVRVEKGSVKYSDTDSMLVNVELKSSTKLGDMKDEYPGEKYAREWVKGNGKSEWKVQSRHTERLKGTFLQPKVYLLEKETPFAKEHLADCKDPKTCKGCATFKVAMKGLPKKERTLVNLTRLRAGETVEFERLEKVRTLAGVGFRRPPEMVRVKKRIVEAYDKRIINLDGVTTRAVVLSLEGGESAEIREAAE